MPILHGMCVISLFVILGIGADDVFVYVDTWRQSFDDEIGVGPTTPLPERVAWTIFKSSSATLTTSATTSAAFFAAALSSITALKSFGIFAGIVVMADWFMMNAWLPAAVVLHHKKWAETPTCCCCIPCKCGCFSLRNPDKGPQDTGKFNARIQTFFHEHAAPAVRRFGLVFTLVLLSLSAVFTYFVVDDPGLRFPTSSVMRLFVGDHPLQKYSFEDKKLFTTEAERAGKESVIFVFGAQAHDLGSSLDPADYGEAIDFLGGGFDPLTPAAQTWMEKFCADLAALDDTPDSAKAGICWTAKAKENCAPTPTPNPTKSPTVPPPTDVPTATPSRSPTEAHACAATDFSAIACADLAVEFCQTGTKRCVDENDCYISDGNECSENSDCTFCSGGTDAGNSCTQNTDCAGGFHCNSRLCTSYRCQAHGEDDAFRARKAQCAAAALSIPNTPFEQWTCAELGTDYCDSTKRCTSSHDFYNPEGSVCAEKWDGQNSVITGCSNPEDRCRSLCDDLENELYPGNNVRNSDRQQQAEQECCPTFAAIGDTTGTMREDLYAYLGPSGPWDDTSFSKSGLVANPETGSGQRFVAAYVKWTTRTAGGISASFDEMTEFTERWTSWFDDQLKTCPRELCGDSQEYAFLSYGGFGPIFFDLRKGLGSGAKESIFSSMILAFGVLLVATRNLWISLCATFTIAAITMVVIGSLVLDGWELNIFESVTMCISVGMSVDFVVHLAHAVAHSHRRAVRDRVAAALDEMGPSISVGALTTFLTGVFMLLADMQPVEILQNTFSDRTRCICTATARVLIPTECSATS